jgi:hypothetical protein
MFELCGLEKGPPSTSDHDKPAAAAQGHCALYRQRRPLREEKSGQVFFRTVTASWVPCQVGRKLLAGTQADCIEEQGVAKIYRKAFQ